MKKIINKYQAVFYFLPIISSLALVFRAFLPFQFFISGITLTVFGVFYLVNFSINKLKENIIISLKNAWLLFTIASVLLAAILFTQTKSSLIEKEVFRILSILVIYISLSLVSIHRDLSFIKKKFIDIFLIYIALIIIYTFYKLTNTDYSFYLFSRDVDFNMTAMYLLYIEFILKFKQGRKC